MRHTLVLAVALISWRVVAQEPPAPVRDPNANGAIESSSLKAEQQPKDTGPELILPPLTPAELPPQEVLSGFPPLSDIGEPSSTGLRFGWWYGRNTGSLVKTGEYQDLFSSPFWEVNGLYSNGYRTFGIYGNQTDNESNQASLHYFSPRLFADIDFQRYIRRLDHIPLDNFLPDNVTNNRLPSNSYAVGRDLNVGEDYAIRVEEFRASIGDRINDNMRFKVDVWQMRKFGERQANAAAHCFKASAAAGTTSGCHVLSQSQHIDWLTVEVNPRLEARFGPVTLEYSRPMRQFSQNDQLVFRDYNNGNLTKPTFSGGMIWGTFPYAIVPENLTQIDQLKGSIDLGATRQVYAFGYVGNTDNRDRDVNRYFNGYDLRLTDWTLPRTTVTLYTKSYNQTGNRPATLNASETQNLTLAQADAAIRTPLEYHRDTAGIKGDWRPDIAFVLFRDLVITSGYEYDYMNRENAVWQTPPLSSPGRPAGFQSKGSYNQENTATHTLFTGARKPWEFQIDTFARYKVLFVGNPLFGFRELSDVLNTNLPQQKHIVEFGGGWYPLGNFAITVQQDIEVGQSHDDHSANAIGNVVDFSEQSYATTLTTYYAPTARLSMIVSFSQFSNWINQNMFLGDDYTDPDIAPTTQLPLVTQPTFYAGTTNLVQVQMNYMLFENVRLTCGYQFGRGHNYFNMDATPSFAFSPGIPAPTYGELPQYSAVLVETNKITAGVSWRPRSLMTYYLNYDLFDYEDKTNSYNSGTAHMVLAGLSRIW